MLRGDFLNKPKTRKQHYIPLSNTLKRFLKEYLNIWNISQMLAMYGDKMSAETLKKAIKYYA